MNTTLIVWILGIAILLFAQYYFRKYFLTRTILILVLIWWPITFLLGFYEFDVYDVTSVEKGLALAGLFIGLMYIIIAGLLKKPRLRAILYLVLLSLIWIAYWLFVFLSRDPEFSSLI